MFDFAVFKICKDMNRFFPFSAFNESMWIPNFGKYTLLQFWVDKNVSLTNENNVYFVA